MRSVRANVIVLVFLAGLSLSAFADSAPDQQVNASTAETAQAAATAPQTPTPPPPAAKAGPFQIKSGDVNIRFGLLLQPQADFSENAKGETGKNLLLRRTRLIAGGQVTKNVFFFFQTESSRLGATNASGTKVISAGFQVIDAVAEYRYSKPLNLWAGLIYLPTSREALKGSSSEFMIDTNSYAYTATTALAGTGGRDTGFMARGYFLQDHLEYRAGVFSGLRDTAAKNAFRTIGRVQYNVFDTEPYALPSYAGSYFGTKKILAIGAAIDRQKDYKGATADVYADFPTSFGSVLGTATYMHLDGDAFVPALGNSNIVVVDGGAYMKGTKLGPWARYEQRNFKGAGSKDEKRYLVGLNFYPYGSNFNIKTAVGRFKPATGNDQKQFVVQLQIFYY